MLLAIQAAVSKTNRRRTHSLDRPVRIYQIFEHNKSAFHARFRDHAWRIMRGYGFDVVAFWESPGTERTEFVDLLQWPNEETMRSSREAFLTDEEWREIKRVTGAQHGDLVGEVSEKTPVPTPTLRLSTPPSRPQPCTLRSGPLYGRRLHPGKVLRKRPLPVGSLPR